MEPFGVDLKNTADVRRRAVELLRKLAQNRQPRIVLRVIQSLTHLLAGIAMPLGLQMPDDFYAQWDGERNEAMEILASIAASDQSAVVKLVVIDALLPFAVLHRPVSVDCEDNGNRATAETARRIIQSVPDDYSFRLLRELRHTNVWDETEDADDESQVNPSARFERAQQRREERRGRLVNEFLTTNPSVDAAITTIVGAIQELQRCGIQPQIERFLCTLGQINPEFALSLARRAIKPGLEEVGTHLTALLIHAKAEHLTESFEIAQTAAGAASPALRCGAAVYLSARARTGLTDSETKLVHELVRDPDGAVRRAAFRTMASLRDSNPCGALAVALAAKLDGEPEVCNDLFLWLIGNGTEKGPMSVATDSQLCLLTEKLIEVPAINDHWVLEFLNFLSLRMPETVLDLLFARMEKEDSGAASSGYEAVPFQIGQAVNGMSGHERAPELLRRVAQAFGSADGRARHRLGDIFEGMSAHFTTPASMELLAAMSRAHDTTTVTDSAALSKGWAEHFFRTRQVGHGTLEECFDIGRRVLP